MAEALHRGSDIPDFDTFPSSPDKQLPERGVTDGRSRLQEPAARAGSMLGKAVVAIRNAQEKLRSTTTASGPGTVSDIADQARDRAEEIGQAAAQRARQWKEALRERTYELRRQARNGIYRVRLRTTRATQEYPVQVALAAGAAGFLLGVALRIRRAYRA